MGRSKKVADDNNEEEVIKEKIGLLIQKHLDKKPFEPYKQSLEEITSWANKVAKDVKKQFNLECVAIIGPETGTPPNQVSWVFGEEAEKWQQKI